MSPVGFHSTRWSLVTRAAGSDRSVARLALAELCELYWYPLYAWLRRAGHDEPAALDLVQSFCADLLERGGLHGADAERGAFRQYLLGALRHFVHNQTRRENAARRGGGKLPWSLDDAEPRYAQEPMQCASPERLFERRWAVALLDRALASLRADYRARNREAVLLALEPALLGHDDALDHAATAAVLGTTEGAVKVALHRMRTRLRELVRHQIAQTLTDPGSVDEELQHLFEALGG